MRLEDVTAEIRPRSNWEAVDLGFAMTRRAFWRCLSVWWLALLLPMLVALAFLWDNPWVWGVLFWWWRPAGSRMVLFELSRRLFGEQPSWKQSLGQIRGVWWRRFFYRFVWARFSPWSPVTMPVEDLEGLRGGGYRMRCRLLMRRGDGPSFWLTAGGSLMATWLTLGVIGLIDMLLPEGQIELFASLWEAVRAGDLTAVPLTAGWLIVGSYCISLCLTDLFVTGAGFGIYVNNRTWIEGWDVELAFKRLANRLGKLAILIFGGLMCLGAGSLRAEEDAPETVIRQVKAHQDFEIQKVRVRESTSSSSSSSPGSMPSWLLGVFGIVGRVFLVLCGVALLALIGWLLWRFRHIFQGRDGPSRVSDSHPSARVVMGMEVSRDSLPEDIPTTAWRWWLDGRRHEALALLYRGAISRSIELGRVEIAESDTEGDCLRRVRLAGEQVHPSYFSKLTTSWIGLAYAKSLPADAEVEALCRSWPYVERRPA